MRRSLSLDVDAAADVRDGCGSRGRDQAPAVSHGRCLLGENSLGGPVAACRFFGRHGTGLGDLLQGRDGSAERCAGGLAAWLPELTGAALVGALAAGSPVDDCGAAAVASLGVVGFVGRSFGATEDIDEMDIMWPIFLGMRSGRAHAR